MKNGLFLLASLLFINNAFGQATSSKQDDIRQLMTMMGTTSLMEQSMNRFVESFKNTNTSLPEKFWTDVMKEANYQDLVNRLVPVYDEHFTHEEIKGLIAFYKSSVGQKAIKELPLIMQESAEVGRTWGEDLGRRIGERIQREQASPKN